MERETISELEEAFFEMNFEYEDDVPTLSENYRSATHIYSVEQKKAADLATKIEDGEVVDKTEVILCLQRMIFAHRFRESFKKSLEKAGEVVCY